MPRLQVAVRDLPSLHLLTRMFFGPIVQTQGMNFWLFGFAWNRLLILLQKCRQECKKSCPVVRTGKLCIEVTPESKIAFISERLCIGCGICPKKCPFGAIHIINLPTNLESEVTHRYSANSFKLHRLPMPRPGQVLGLVGTNGIGKSTALKVLSGKLKPNLGRYDNPPDWEEILKYFRGSELQSTYFPAEVQNKACRDR